MPTIGTGQNTYLKKEGLAFRTGTTDTASLLYDDATDKVTMSGIFNLSGSLSISGNPVMTGDSGYDSDTLQTVTDRGNTTNLPIVATMFSGTNGQTQLKGSTTDSSAYTFIARNYASTSLLSIRNDGRIDAAGPVNIGNNLYLDNNEIWAQNSNNLNVKADGLIRIQPQSYGTAATFAADGNVGIGVGDPAYRLVVAGGDGNIEIGSGIFNDYNAIRLNDSSSSNDYNLLSSATDTHLYINRPASKTLYFRCNNQNQMLLKSDGQLQLTSSDPVLKITDTSTSDNTATLWLQESDSYGVKLNYESHGSPDFRQYLSIDTLATADSSNQLGDHLNVFGVDIRGNITPHKGATDGNLLTPYEWDIYSLNSGSTYRFNQNGDQNTRVLGLNPHGDPATLWRAGNDVDNNDDGGWNTDYFEIDRTKTYRCSVWVKKDFDVQDGNLYMGTSFVDRLTNGDYDSNPYWLYPAAGTHDINSGQWYLFVGYVYPSGTTPTSTPITRGGVYNRNGEKLVDTNWEYRWTSSGDSLFNPNTSRQRVYNYYDTGVNNVTYWWQPRFEPIEADTPSLRQLLDSPSSQTGAYFMGRVGIGTDNPASPLSVVGTARIDGSDGDAVLTIANSAGSQSLRIDQNSLRTTTTNDLTLFTKDNSFQLVLDQGGNVGIGTNSPAMPLSVHSAEDTLADFYSTDGEAGIRIRDSHDTVYVSSDNNIGSIGPHLGYNTGNLNIDLISGNVGIGVTNPSAFNSYARRLVIGEGGSKYEGITIYTDGSRQGSIHFADGTVGNQAYAGYVSYRHSSNRLDFGAGGGTRMVVNGNGAGIGTYTVDSKLTVSGAWANSIAVFRNGPDNVKVEITEDADIEASGWISSHNTGTSRIFTSEIAGDAASNALVMETDGAGNRTRLYNYGTSTDFLIESKGSSSDIRINAREAIRFYTSGSASAYSYGGERMTITEAGNVGIGSATPRVALDVNGEIRNLAKVSRNYRTGLGTTTLYVGTVDLTGNGDGAGFKIKVYDPAEKVWRLIHVTIQNSGGTNSTSVTVEGGGEDTEVHINLLYKNRDGDATKTDFFLDPTATISFTQYIYVEGYIITDTGYNDTSATSVDLDVEVALYQTDAADGSNVGIGTVNPLAKLHVSGSVMVDSNQGNGGLYVTRQQYLNEALKISTNDEGSYFTIIQDESSAGFGKMVFQADADHNHGYFGYEIGGFERMRLNVTGLGIGVTDPDQKLDVNGNIRIPNEGKIVFGSAGTASDYLQLHDVGAGNPLLKLVQDTATRFSIEGVNGNVYMQGDVGIGETDPDEKLEVAGNILAKDAFVSAGLGAARGYQFHDFGTGWGYKAVTSSSRLGIFTDTAERVTIASNGNVGIGNTTPADELQVEGQVRIDGSTTDGLTVTSSSGASQGLLIYNNSNTDTANIINYYDGPLVLGQNNAEVMRLHSNGYVGIGTTNPSTILNVSGGYALINSPSAGFSESLRLQRNGAGYYSIGLDNNDLNFCYNGQSADGSILVLDGAANSVGIGTKSPYAYDTTGTKLHVKNAGSAGSVSELARFEGASDADGAGAIVRIGTSNDRGVYLEGGRVGDVPYASIGVTEYDGAKTAGIRISDAGTVGIGTDSVNVGIGLQVQNGGIYAYNGDGYFDTINAAYFSSTRDLTLKCGAAGNVILQNSSYLTLSAHSGKVGIGVEDPAYNLDLATGNTIRINSGSANSTAIRIGGGNNDVTLMRVDSLGGTTDKSQYGFSINYMGTRSDTANSLSIFADNKSAGTQIEAVTINQSGFVGIGATEPEAKLEIHAGTAANIFLRSSGHNPAESSRIRFAETFTTFQGGFVHYDGSANVLNIGVHPTSDETIGNDINAISIARADGDVGIGTAAPSEKLHVVGHIQIDAGTNNNHTGQLGFQTTYDTAFLRASYTDPSASTETYLAFHANTAGAANGTVAEQMRIKGSNVGIGTNNPTEKLTVKGSIVATNTSNVTIGGITFSSNDGRLFASQSDGTAKVLLDSNGVSYLNGGNVGIGIAAPSNKLHVVGTTRPMLIESDNSVNIVKLGNSEVGVSTYNGMDLLVNSSVASSISAYGMPLTFGTSTGNGVDATERVRIATGGNVGIGTAAPRQKLDVSGVIAQSTTTVSALPSVTNNQGARSMVTDSQIAASSNFGATIAGYGGGAYTVPVWCDGSYWYIG